MKNLIVQTDQTDTLNTRVKVAADLASLFDATVRGVYVAPPTAYAIRAEVGIPESVWENYRKLLFQGESHAKAIFDQVLTGANVEHAWVQPIQSGAAGLCHECMFADLVILSQSATHKLGKIARDLTDDVILQSRKPCLVVPDSFTDTVSLDRVCIAWNGSDECGRVVQSSLALLQKATSVEVVQFATSQDAAADTTALEHYLAQYDITPKITLVTDVSNVGHQLLDFAKRHDHKLIVLGAYGHPRMREIIMGGVTRHVLDKADQLILVSH